MLPMTLVLAWSVTVQDTQVACLVKQLGDERYAVRAAAHTALERILLSDHGHLYRVRVEAATRHRDLEIARRSLPELPRRARAAVSAAHGLFASLTARCRATPASEIIATRIRVPDGEKLAIAVRSALGTGGGRR